MKNNFIIATHNIHKIKEIETILNFYRQHGEGYRKKLPQQTFPPESTVSYEENAKAKALFISQQLPTAKIIADDSRVASHMAPCPPMLRPVMARCDAFLTVG